MDTKQILGTSIVPEMVKYWSWANDNELGVVGINSVYHVSIKDLGNQNQQKVEPQKMFD